MSDRITRGRNAIFGHVARLPVNTPAHPAMLRQVEHMDPRWKRPPGRPRTKRSHCDSVEASYWSRSLESDATVRADYALTTTTTSHNTKWNKFSFMAAKVLFLMKDDTTEPRIKRENNIGYILCKVHRCGNSQS